MTQSYSHTESWSRTHARRVSGKVAADLRQLNQEYGSPSDAKVGKYMDERTELLAEGYVDEVTYGFKRNGDWIVALRYKADTSGNLTTDDRSGRIPRGENIDGASQGSFLTYSRKWDELSTQRRQNIKDKLPIERSNGDEPGVPGRVVSDKRYSSAGQGMHRQVIRP